MTERNTVIKMSVQRMVCTGCGSEANASCGCGVSYVPKASRARELRAAEPNRSLGSIAEELGMARQSVSDALKVAGDLPPTEVIGRDGKSYPIKPRLVVGHDDDEDDEHLAFAQTKDAFIARAAEAEADAKYFGNVDQEVILAAEETAAAWGQLVSKLKGNN